MQTILVCDDDKQIVEAIDIYLTGEGFKVIKAYDGYEALEYLDKNEVDLLIVDVMMPGLDGIRTTLKVRENSSIPIIILSAKSEDADKILGLNIGADDYTRGDVQAVLAVLAGCDGADKGVVLVVELRGVEPLEDGVGVEGLAFAPHVDDVAERHGHALDGAPVTVVLGAGEHSPLESDFMLHRCLFLPVSLRAGACSPLSGLRPRSSRRPR